MQHNALIIMKTKIQYLGWAEGGVAAHPDQIFKAQSSILLLAAPQLRTPRC